ncbi:hypothetical protein [Fusibacter bizertensis]
MKKIAIIGSSGGNLYNLGGKEPHKLLNEILQQADSAGILVTDIVFVGANMSMDKASDSTQARLITIDTNITMGDYEKLNVVNEKAKQSDEMLAQKILGNEIDGIVVMSADPSNVNKASLEAAAKTRIPIVGTGGTSMAKLQNIGANILAVSGTTGTTNRTRAISAISSLSKAYGIKYKPVIGTSSSSSTEIPSNIKDRISIRGIMMASLPGFIAMSLVLALSKISFLSEFEELFNILINILPVIVAAIAAKQVSGLDEIGIVSGIVAGALSTQGGIIGGILGGVLAGVLASYLIRKSFDLKIPGTTANLIGGGLSGLIAGLVVYFLIAPIALALGNGIRDLIEGALAFSPILAGLLAGALIWPAILGGVYHAAILPIVLLEMEKTGMSFLGAVDMVGLVMVSAGITLANIISPRHKENRSLAVPGFLINIGFGTFVEAAYPFMFSSKYVMGIAILSASVGGLLVGVMGVFGTAYVPSVVAPGLSNSPLGFAICMIISMLISMTLTILANRFTKEKIND